jgi:NAD(P)-dependent dehydrogenase (short-subunit alcohol dehydrogenase family)
MTELRFDNCVAIITGAGRGLGRAYAMLLSERGAKVVVNDPGGSIGGVGADASPAQEVVAEIIASGGEAVASFDSVATPEGGQAIVDAAIDRYGRVDILVHNAGNTRRASVLEMTNEEFNAVLDVHLKGALHVGQPAYRHMCKSQYGRIVLTSSIAGLYGEPKVMNYSTAKAGIIGLCNVLALDGAPFGVKCNVILPSAVTRLAEGRDTSAYPPLGPELVAPVVAWLCHETCSISGEMLIALGGRVARAYVVESPGVFRKEWTVEQVAADIEKIRHEGTPWELPVVPNGFTDHLKLSFAMAKRGRSEG